MKVNFNYVGAKGYGYIPKHASVGASGCDLRNASGEDIVIPPGESVMIPTGICVEIPEGYEGQVRPRSGISVKRKVIMLPSVGTIDSDYRGEIKVTYYNPTDHRVYITSGERMAQLIIAPYVSCEYNFEEELDKTNRGTGGFGSTGS